ncbi:hypothetical protein TELCIR_17855, partial [Teladorsagia circumcincta]
MQSKKWRRDERRQRELEQRLALALTTSHLTSEALANPLWKELLEAAQPKFTLNDDPQYFEQLISTLHLRLLQSIRALLASAVCVSVLVDWRIVDLPLSEPFPVLAEAVMNIKHAVDQVSTDASIARLSDEQ